MKKIILILVLILLGACKNISETKETAIAPPPEISVEDFFKNSEQRSFRISPDGTHLAYLAPYNKRMNIHVRAIDSEEVVRITSVEDRDIAGYFWANNDKLVYIKDDGGNENFHLFSVNKKGDDEVDLTPFDGVRAQIVDDLENNENEMIIELNNRIPQVFDPYRININTGKMELIYENPGNITGWQTDHDGKLRIAYVTNGVDNSILYRETEKDDFKEVITTNFKQTLTIQFFDFDNGNVVYALSNLGRDKLAVVKYDLKENKEIEEIYINQDVDVDEVSYSDKRKVLTSINYNDTKQKRKFLDEETEQLFSRLEKELGDTNEYYITSSNKNEDKFLVYVGNDTSRGAYYFYDKESKELKKIADLSPWINPDHMASMKPISYTSRDGLTIHGYLSLPIGREAKNLPVVINPHGGPWARDFWGYNPEVQLLANRGYAVLQMNFRGSTGYGKAFWEKSFKQWGQSMQNDVTDGVHWLIDQGIADPDRIAIYGGSYGGYATLAGITNTPDLYAAAVDYVGVSNLFTFMETIPPYWEPYKEMLYEMVGDPNSNDSIMMKANSPVFQVNKITAALFVAQGANDPRVAKDESDQMVNALEKRGVPIQYMLKENEGHGFRNEENRFDFYNAMTEFLDTNMKEKVDEIKT
ncbi:S9 family peptidase [Ulvibacter antarcticus]|uniref:Dipeptidyl aminopeptidase/acylaminoacyl peptidase n=1 Tax=Ulvibacter antarcticus TaxID=442714 RepID=A0A3L9ZCS6_9FLAO|nr:S9 family peptidase [Ulvibacter antarcticus]RMA64452.1 dipeptidyl aminopeptidase/acylaminoacyl peptidase [Ulvibacter antarcticus]